MARKTWVELTDAEILLLRIAKESLIKTGHALPKKFLVAWRQRIPPTRRRALKPPPPLDTCTCRKRKKGAPHQPLCALSPESAAEPRDFEATGSGPEIGPITEWHDTKKKCPKCGFEGRVLPDFGVKTARGVERAQSWCLKCRASTNYYRPGPERQAMSARSRQLRKLRLTLVKNG